MCRLITTCNVHGWCESKPSSWALYMDDEEHTTDDDEYVSMLCLVYKSSYIELQPHGI